MIWARPWAGPGTLDASSLARLGFDGDPSAAAFVAALPQTALLTGLDEAAVAALRCLPAGTHLVGRGGTALLQLAPAGLDAFARATSCDARLAKAVRRWFGAAAPLEPTIIGPRRFEWGARTYVMGVVNVTPDSFSDGGQLGTVTAAVQHAETLLAAGADLLDVGGESTRPGAAEVSEAEELRRVLPVVEALAARFPHVPISIDTSKPPVARRAVQAGAHLVNDVTGLRQEAMLEVVAELGVSACAMHMHGTPRTMQNEPRYDDVVGTVLDALEGALSRAETAGVPRHRVLVDPGIGFGKTAAHNLELLRHASALRLLGAPVLIGTSRKAFLGALVGGTPAERDGATAASVAALAAARGADIVRVHDVAKAREAAVVGDALAHASGSAGPSSA